MNAFSFAPATREQARARIGLQGPAGCGKTKTALRIAEGLAQGGQIGLIDTERRSALTYAIVPGKPHLGGHEFGHMPMNSYDPRNLIKAVHEAELARLEVLIVDSWSHFWTGRGGLLEIVNQSGGTFSDWKKGNPIEQDMLDALLNFSGHLIVTMRTKTHYAIDTTGPKQKITKVGTKVVQREGTEYELGLIIDMVEGTGTVTKTRYEPLEGLTIHHPGEELGQQVLEQLGQGIDPVAAIVDAATADLTLDAALQLSADAARRNVRQANILHPTGGQPTTVDALLRERLGDVVTGLLADESMTYERAIEMHRRAEAGGWIAVERMVEEDGGLVMFTLGDLIKARGTELRPAPPKAPQDSTPNSSGATPTQGQQQSGGEAVTAPQSRKIFATLAELGLDNSDRERRLRAISLIVGRQVPTQNDLTFGEAAVVIETLDSFEGENAPDHFREHLNTLLEAVKQPSHA
ncbi:AAA family ATPase [Streptomyces sp. NPDC087894]|uniref:AAA family ATPase n=1 Tax=Streptomyces sp. NPDC087894 TaxID=3365816 RepID=UPI0038148726